MKQATEILPQEAAVANGIRNPLAAIRIQMECWRAQMDDMDPRRPSLDQTLEEIERIANTVEAVLDHGTPAPLQPDFGDLGAALAEATSACLPRAERCGVRVRREGFDRKISVFTDAAVFGKAVRRLLENAIDASPEGAEVQAFLDLDSRGITVNVVDHGCGMDESTIRALETPFATNRPRGLGLGAHLALRDLRRLGASVEVFSLPEQGTTVRIRLAKREDAR